MTIQISFLGPQGQDVPGKVGNLQSIDPVYEGNNVLVGAVLHVIRPLDKLGIVCIPLKKYMVTYPINAKFHETDGQNGRWSNFIPAELFKPPLEDMLWNFKNNVHKSFCIQGDFLGVESYNTENQRLNDAKITSTIRNQYLHETVLKLRGIIMDQGADIWEAEVKGPTDRTLALLEKTTKISAMNAPRSMGYGRRGGRRYNQSDEQPLDDPYDDEGRVVDMEIQAPKKGKFDALKAFLPGGK
ncbi:MAG: hypothetical protein V3U02_12450 [Calditrichia bacterium]